MERRFNYDKAESDLEDMGCRYPDEIYNYEYDEIARDNYLLMHDLDPERYKEKEY